MANTENIEAKLCAYVDGELDPAGRAEIEAHLTANPQHRQLMTELMSQRDLLRGLPRERAPEDLFESMTNQLERSVLLDGDAAQGGGGGGAGSAGAPHIAGQINRWPQVFAAAAVLVLAIGLAAVIYFVLPNQQQPDYARVGTASPAPIARGEASRRVGGVAESQPTVLADRAEAKTGALPPADGRTRYDLDAATSAPVAVAAVPPPRDDIFSKSAARPDANATVLGKGGFNGLSRENVYTNVFADSQLLNEKLKSIPGVPDKSMVAVVSAENPSATNQQLRDYFSNNGIKWEPAEEPMPAPLNLRQSQTVVASRLGQTQMKLKGGSDSYAGGFGGGGASVGGGGGGGPGFGGTSNGKMAEPPPAPNAAPVPPDATDNTGARQQLAQNEPDRAKAFKEDTSRSRDKNKDVSAQKQTAAAAARAPAPSQAPGAAGAYAEKSQLSDARNTINGASGVNAPPTNMKSNSGAPAGQANSASGDQSTVDEVAQRSQAANEGEVKQSTASPAQPAPAAPSAPSDQAGQPAAPPAIAQSQQPQQQVQQQRSTPQQDLAAQQSELQMEGGQGQMPAPSQQVYIARGVTRKQLTEMNSVIANGNRVNNYSRSGDRITPAAPLPALDQKLKFESSGATSEPAAAVDAGAAKGPLAKSSTESESARSYSANVQAAPATSPSAGVTGSLGAGAGTGWAATTQPATAPSESLTFAEEGGRFRAVTPTTGPLARPATTAPAAAAATSTSPAEERVDVVILVQPETDGALIPQDDAGATSQAVPNAAAIDAPQATSAPTPTSATSPTTAAAPAPAPAPAAR